AEQRLRALVLAHALHHFLDCLRLVALRLEVGFDDEPPAALGFLRPLRAVRRPWFADELRPALAQQSLQRAHGSGRAGHSVRDVGLTALEAKRLRQLAIDAGERNPFAASVRGLRPIAKALGGCSARGG